MPGFLPDLRFAGKPVRTKFWPRLGWPGIGPGAGWALGDDTPLTRCEGFEAEPLLPRFA